MEHGTTDITVHGTTQNTDTWNMAQHGYVEHGTTVQSC